MDGLWTGFSGTLPLYTLLMNRGPSPDMDDFPPSRLNPSPAEVFSTSTHRASCAATLLPAGKVAVTDTHYVLSSPPNAHSRPVCPAVLVTVFETSGRAVSAGCVPVVTGLEASLLWSSLTPSVHISVRPKSHLGNQPVRQKQFQVSPQWLTGEPWGACAGTHTTCS